jgi:hypothetical protein
MRAREWMVISAAVCLSIALTGCGGKKRDESTRRMPQRAETPKKQHGEDFPAEDEVRQVDRFAAVQAAAGARYDSTLYSVHFDGGALNTLGQSKLNMMFQEGRMKAGTPVYIDLPQDDAFNNRKESVEHYVGNLNTTGRNVKVIAGGNPAVLMPAQSGLMSLPRTASDYKSNTESTTVTFGAGSSVTQTK